MNSQVNAKEWGKRGSLLVRSCRLVRKKERGTFILTVYGGCPFLDFIIFVRLNL